MNQFPVPTDFLNRSAKKAVPMAVKLTLGRQSIAKNGEVRPTSVQNWRVTSGFESLLTQIRDEYDGGVINPVGNPGQPGRFDSNWELELPTNGESRVFFTLTTGHIEYQEMSGRALVGSCDRETFRYLDRAGVATPCHCKDGAKTKCTPFGAIQGEWVMPKSGRVVTASLESHSNNWIEELAPALVNAYDTQETHRMILVFRFLRSNVSTYSALESATKARQYVRPTLLAAIPVERHEYAKALEAREIPWLVEDRLLANHFESVEHLAREWNDTSTPTTPKAVVEEERFEHEPVPLATLLQEDDDETGEIDSSETSSLFDDFMNI